MKFRRGVAVCATVAMLGCSSVLGSNAPEVTLSLRSEEAVPAYQRLDVTIGGREFRLEPLDEGASERVRAPRVGELPVRVTLVDHHSVSAAAVEFTQRYQEDSNHWVSVLVGLRRPLGHCFGQLIVTPLSLAGTANPDTMFVMYGGLPKNAVC